MFKIINFEYEKADGSVRAVRLFPLFEDDTSYAGIDLGYLSADVREELEEMFADFRELIDIAIDDEKAYRKFLKRNIESEIDVEE